MSDKTLMQPLADLGWALWSQLGVSGWPNQHSRWCVDPEALIVLTAWLGDFDARLRDEATDWCIEFADLTSATRLTNILASSPACARERFGVFAATVRAHSNARWSGATQARPFTPTGRSHIDSLAPRSRIALRLRSLLGVSARAEVIRLLLATDPLPQTASDLVMDAAIKKRPVAEALHRLESSGVLAVRRVRNQHQYRLAAPAAWAPLLGALPEAWPRWAIILPLLMRIVDALDAAADDPEQVRRVALHKIARKTADMVDIAQLPGMKIERTRQDNASVETWFLDVAHRLVEGDASVIGGAAMTRAPNGRALK